MIPIVSLLSMEAHIGGLGLSPEFTLEEAEVAVSTMNREIEGLDPIKVAVSPQS